MRHLGLSTLVLLGLLGAGCVKEETYPVRDYRMGDRIEIGSLVYNVFDTQWVTHLGDLPSGRVPEKRFLLVRASIVNSGGQTITIPTFQVIDDSGQAHSELSDGADVPSWIGFLREIRPAESMQGNIVFDVDPAHYKLRVADESGDRVAMVNLPLKFEADNPAMAAPMPEADPQFQIGPPDAVKPGAEKKMK